MEQLPNPENIESKIEKLLAELDNYALDQFPEKIQNQLADEWYTIEMEARVSANREEALTHLTQFIEKLSNTENK
jgi:uncharacterized protein YbcI